MAAAKLAEQAHGYGGLNFRGLAAEVGIRAASIYHYFPSKADLGAAVARRYWGDTVVQLDGMRGETPEPAACLGRYPEVFRKALETGNRMCLCSFMGAEFYRRRHRGYLGWSANPIDRLFLRAGFSHGPWVHPPFSNTNRNGMARGRKNIPDHTRARLE